MPGGPPAHTLHRHPTLDREDLDAGGGDAVLQYLVYGEVIFG